MSKWGRLGIAMCLMLSTPIWASIGKVSLLKGEAIASRDQQNVALFNGTNLEFHDVIKTRANSQIQLTFEDKTVITLGSESVLDIQEYLNDEQNPKAKFKFSQGTFKSITGHIGKKAPENFNLETRTATIGIRGTTVLGHIGQGETPDTIGCSSGQIVVSAGGVSIVVNQGSQTSVSKGQAPTPPAPLNLNLAQPSQSDVPLSNPKTPTTAEQASQTNQQSHTATNLLTQVEKNSDHFYPTFNPPLQATSTNTAPMYLSGYTTSQYTSNGTTLTSTTDTISLAITNDSLINGETDVSTIALARNLDGSVFLDLSKSPSPSTMTYKNINEFSIKDFDQYKGWMQTENTYTNDYVSWGYWAIKANDNTMLLPTTNYWVAGVNANDATAYINALLCNGTTASYTYNGHVLGYVTDGTHNYTIDPTTGNAVVLKFDVGGGANAIAEGSHIAFQTLQETPQSWNIAVSTTSAINNDGTNFNASNQGNVKINNTPQESSSSFVTGSFYGSSAQAVGGTFKANTSTQTAVGVFKATQVAN